MFSSPTLRPGTGADTAVLLRRVAAFAVDFGGCWWRRRRASSSARRSRTRPRRASRRCRTAGRRSYCIFAATQALFAQTLGKYLLGVAVADEGPPSTDAVVVRTSLLPVDLLFAGVPALVSLAFSERRQRVGDRVAGTVVVRAER